MLPKFHLDPESDAPLHRQVYEQLSAAILSGRMAHGERLPPTRELAGSLGLNRSTLATAFERLESEGLIRSHVGKGTFVEGPGKRVDWAAVMPAEEISPGEPVSVAPLDAVISFSASRPSQIQFPLDEFRETCREVIDSADAPQILQLGSAGGYGPLRRYLLNEARRLEFAREDDDILITSGAQQAFDLIQRVLAANGETVLIEDPVYPGLRNAFTRGGARVIGVPMGESGIDLAALEKSLEREHPRLMVLTPNFQNPTGSTIPAADRQTILELAQKAGTIIIESDLYGGLRYQGEDVPSIKRMDESGDTILLGSFSKIAFPGLRVGWVIGPRRFIARLTEAKEACDLHSDQLSQAVLLKFAESGRLEAHRKKMIAAGAERLNACLECCAKDLPSDSYFTRPEGGMSVWVVLPETVDASELAKRALAENVSFLPGRYFAVSRAHPHSLRLCFVGLSPEQIQFGMRVLGQLIKTELTQGRSARRDEPSPALV
jgi:2-aminoadipate transaminase